MDAIPLIGHVFSSFAFRAVADTARPPLRIAQDIRCDGRINSARRAGRIRHWISIPGSGTARHRCGCMPVLKIACAAGDAERLTGSFARLLLFTASVRLIIRAERSWCRSIRAPDRGAFWGVIYLDDHISGQNQQGHNQSIGTNWSTTTTHSSSR